MTLREGSREYFYRQLDRLFPGLKERYIQTYGMQYELESPNSRRLMAMFVRMCKDRGMMYRNEQIFQYLHTFEEKCRNIQLSLFDDFGTV